MATEHGETKKKTFSLFRVGLAVVLIVGTFLGLQIWCMYSQKVVAEEVRQKVEAESFLLLKAAESPEDLREAVGRLGHFFELSNSEWVAVRYVDSHIWPGWSSAVAVDSGGVWWISDEHFCGRFKSFRHQMERVTNATDLEKREFEVERLEAYSELNALQNASSLEDAHVKLRRLGFSATPPPH